MKQGDAGDRGQGPDAHVSERLDAYRTGELDEAGRARVEAHLAACERCREELAALASWTSAVERGYEARRAESSGLEPDWAAQRAAIVARTSARARAGERQGAFGRWAPQIALVAVAALIVGIVWRENPREPADATRTAESGRASSPFEPGAVDVEAPPAAPEATVAAPQAEEHVAHEGREVLADRLAEPSLDALLAVSLADVERFERGARAALEARDTTAARRALSLWRDTLSARGDTVAAPAGFAGPASLADSLREFLEPAE